MCYNTYVFYAEKWLTSTVEQAVNIGTHIQSRFEDIPKVQKKTSFKLKVTFIRCLSIKIFRVFRLTNNHIRNVTIIHRRVMIASVPHTTSFGLAVGLVVEKTINIVIHINEIQVGPTVEFIKKKRDKLPFSSTLAMSEIKIFYIKKYLQVVNQTKLIF